MSKTVDDFLSEKLVGSDVGSLENFLAQYGVLGMKWGVRKDRHGVPKSGVAGGDVERKHVSVINKNLSRRDEKDLVKITNGIKKVLTDPNNKAIDTIMDPVSNYLWNNGAPQDMSYSDVMEALSSVAPALEEIARIYTPSGLHTEVTVEEYDPDARNINDIYFGITVTAGDYYLERLEQSDISNKSESFNLYLEYDSTGKVIGLTSNKSIVKQSNDTLEDFLAHYGVLGMKWGVRKDRQGNRQTRKEAKKALKESRRSNQNGSTSKNTLRNNPQNRRKTDAELNRLVNRIRMEQELARLTATPPAQRSRVQQMLTDIAFDVTKGALTTVGKAALSKAIGVQYNKLAGEDYKISLSKKK